MMTSFEAHTFAHNAGYGRLATNNPDEYNYKKDLEVMSYKIPEHLEHLKY